VSKEALLELVRWNKANNERKTSWNGLGQDSREQPPSIDDDTWGNGLQCSEVQSNSEEKG